MEFDRYTEKHFETATELWEALGATKKLAEGNCDFIYRGQANSEWPLLPSIYRESTINRLKGVTGNEIENHWQVIKELYLLKGFVENCDQIGLSIANDSIEFRKKHLEIQDKYTLEPDLWPDEKLFELMALAQHHGVPTRLLDWSRQPYIAIYFAMSSALSRIVDKQWKAHDKLAIWALNINQISHYNVKVISVPGSISPHVASQSGLFTVQNITSLIGSLPEIGGIRESGVEMKGLENEFSTKPDSPLMKLTVPITESLKLYDLCKKSGLTGATIFSSADGVGKAVIDGINRTTCYKILNPNSMVL